MQLRYCDQNPLNEDFVYDDYPRMVYSKKGLEDLLNYLKKTNLNEQVFYCEEAKDDIDVDYLKEYGAALSLIGDDECYVNIVISRKIIGLGIDYFFIADCDETFDEYFDPRYYINEEEELANELCLQKDVILKRYEEDDYVYYGRPENKYYFLYKINGDIKNLFIKDECEEINISFLQNCGEIYNLTTYKIYIGLDSCNIKCISYISDNQKGLAYAKSKYIFAPNVKLSKCSMKLKHTLIDSFLEFESLNDSRADLLREQYCDYLYKTNTSFYIESINYELFKYVMKSKVLSYENAMNLYFVGTNRNLQVYPEFNNLHDDLKEYIYSTYNDDLDYNSKITLSDTDFITFNLFVEIPYNSPFIVIRNIPENITIDGNTNNSQDLYQFITSRVSVGDYKCRPIKHVLRETSSSVQYSLRTVYGKQKFNCSKETYLKIIESICMLDNSHNYAYGRDTVVPINTENGVTDLIIYDKEWFATFYDILNGNKLLKRQEEIKDLFALDRAFYSLFNECAMQSSCKGKFLGLVEAYLTKIYEDS